MDNVENFSGILSSIVSENFMDAATFAPLRRLTEPSQKPSHMSAETLSNSRVRPAAASADWVTAPALLQPLAPLPPDPVPCLTLLSDFGLQDASLATTKGILMQHLPEVPMVDVSHDVEPFHLQQAAYLLLSSYASFPEGSVHVMLFDVWSEATPRLLLCERGGHFFLAPDNGVLPLAFGSEMPDVWTCYELPKTGCYADWIQQVGRIARAIFCGRSESIKGERCTTKAAPTVWQPCLWDDAVECQVIHIDRYENVVLNMRREQFDTLAAGRPFRVRFMRDDEISGISHSYCDVPAGEKLVRFNRSGFMEICMNRGKAASLLGFSMRREQHVIYSTVRIFFDAVTV
jgi:S-adenosylmethionine hydrolase